MSFKNSNEALSTLNDLLNSAGEFKKSNIDEGGYMTHKEEVAYLNSIFTDCYKRVEYKYGERLEYLRDLSKISFDELRDIATVVCDLVNLPYDIRKSIIDSLNKEFDKRLDADILKVYKVMLSTFNKEDYRNENRFTLLSLKNNKNYDAIAPLINAVRYVYYFKAEITADLAVKLRDIFTIQCSGRFYGENVKEVTEAENLFVKNVFSNNIEDAYDMTL